MGAKKTTQKSKGGAKPSRPPAKTSGGREAKRPVTAEPEAEAETKAAPVPEVESDSKAGAEPKAGGRGRGARQGVDPLKQPGILCWTWGPALATEPWIPTPLGRPS